MKSLVRLAVAAAWLSVAGAGLANCSPQPKATGLVGVDALVKAGIPGHWAVDCARANSGENPHLFYEIPASGLPLEKLVMDVQHDRTTPIENIRELEGGFIEWTQPIQNKQKVTVVTKLEKQRQKTWTSTLSDGTVLISNGQYDGGGDAPWFNKCD